jgi:hypothetical protein
MVNNHGLQPAAPDGHAPLAAEGAHMELPLVVCMHA